MRAREEGPADLDFAVGGIVAVETRRADDFAITAIDGDEGSAGFQSLAEELVKDLILVTIAGGMLLPDQRIGGDRVEFAIIVRAKRAELDEFAAQGGLEFEGRL